MRTIDGVKSKTGNVKKTTIRWTSKNKKGVRTNSFSKYTISETKENKDERKIFAKGAMEGEGGKMGGKESDQTPGINNQKARDIIIAIEATYDVDGTQPAILALKEGPMYRVEVSLGVASNIAYPTRCLPDTVAQRNLVNKTYLPNEWASKI